MIYVRSMLFGLLEVVVFAIACGAINFVRGVSRHLFMKSSDSLDMSGDLTALLKSPLLWVFEFLVFGAGFYWKFRQLSN